MQNITRAQQVQALRSAADELEQQDAQTRLPPGHKLVREARVEYRVEGPGYAGAVQLDAEAAVEAAVEAARQAHQQANPTTQE